MQRQPGDERALASAEDGAEGVVGCCDGGRARFLGGRGLPQRASQPLDKATEETVDQPAARCGRRDCDRHQHHRERAQRAADVVAARQLRKPQGRDHGGAENEGARHREQQPVDDQRRDAGRAVGGPQPDQAGSLTDAQEREQHADAGGGEAPHERRPPAGAGLRRQKQPPRYRRDGGASSVGEEQPEDLAPDLRQLGAQGADSGALDGDPNKTDPNNPRRASDNRSRAVAHLT